MNSIEKQAFIDAAKEVETDKTDSGTWIKAMALARGDEGLAKHEYIRLRAEEAYGAETEAKLKPGERHESSVTYHLSDLIPKKTWWFYFLPAVVQFLAGPVPVDYPGGMHDFVIGLTSTLILSTVTVAFLCSIGRAIQALFKWSGAHAIAALIWAVIPLFHLGLTAFVVYRLRL